jgi:hypothetical protein
VPAWLAASLSGLAVALSGAAPDDARYWGVADRLGQRLESTWNAEEGYYRLGSGGVDTAGNANMLLVHSVAASSGHAGPARQDGRARQLVDSLLASPPYSGGIPPARRGQPHAHGWVGSMDTLRSWQHMVIDAEVIDGLLHAWLARGQLGLSPSAQALLRARVSAVVSSRFWRWPEGTSNQFNWPARAYTAHAVITGHARLVRHDLRLQIARFLARVRDSRRRTGNLGPGLRFRYSPGQRVGAPLNVDSAEYASMVASFARFYPLARRLGMAAPRESRRRLLRSWLRRVVAGYWTHAGYLNWDTGLGFRRWHQSQKLGLAQQALIGIASAPQLAPPRLRAWARWMLDRGFEFYERQAALGEFGVAPGVFFGASVLHQTRGNARLGAARMAGNAARAIAAGLGGARVERPPPLYSFDPDTGRLAVTTPAYNTAIVPVSQGAFPYGGIELARLYDGAQEVAANIGGRAPAGFGLRVSDERGREVIVTQAPRTTLPAGAAPLRLTRAPAGVGVPPRTSARAAYAGPFDDLRAAGHVRSRALRADVTHRFTAGFVESSWSLRGSAGRQRYSVDVLFPSHGRGAQITAVLRDGSRLAVGDAPIAFDAVAHLYVRSARSGYVVVPGTAGAGVTARAIRPAAQSSAPDPGPSLAVGLARRWSFERLEFAARIAPVPAGDDPAAAARRLAWR